METTPKLKPCPCCGSKSVVWSEHYRRVRCNGCFIGTAPLGDFDYAPDVLAKLKANSFEAWNTRTDPAHDALVEAVQANFAWHVAEDLSLGSFQARMELCNYAHWLTKRALGDDANYQGIPRLLLDAHTFNVDIARCDVEGCKALVQEALAAAALKAAEEERQ